MEATNQNHKDSDKRQKFRDQWLKDEHTSYFIERSKLKDSQGKPKLDQNGNFLFNESSYYCKLCEKDLSCEHFNRHITQSIKHILSTPGDKRNEFQLLYLKQALEKAQKKKDLNKNQLSITNSVSKQENKVAKALVAKFRIIGFFIKHNLPMSLLDDFLGLLKDLRDNQELLVASSIKMSRETATILAKEGICSYLKESLIQRMKKFPFTISVDEATDSFKKKFLLVMIRFLNEENMEYGSKYYNNPKELHGCFK